MPAIKKDIHFTVPARDWELFYRVFSGPGERTAFLRAIVKKAIVRGKEQFSEQIIQDLLDDYGR